MINIDELTIGQVREIKAMLPVSQSGYNNVRTRYAGKYVIVRSRNEGINAGFVVAANQTEIILKDARRIWYHKPADKSLAWYEGVAVSGVSVDSKLSCAVPEKAIVEDYSITVCTDTAAESIQKAKSHGQS